MPYGPACNVVGGWTVMHSYYGLMSLASLSTIQSMHIGLTDCSWCTDRCRISFVIDNLVLCKALLLPNCVCVR